MGRWSTRQAAFAAAAAVALAVVLIAVSTGRDNGASVETIADPPSGADSAIALDDLPDTGGEHATPTVPRTGRTRVQADGGRSAPPVTGVQQTPAGVDPSLIPEGFRIGYRYTDPDAPSAVVISRYDFSGERTVFTAPPGATYTAAEWSPTRDRILIGYCVERKCSIRTVTPEGVAERGTRRRRATAVGHRTVAGSS